jgi:tetratricopeptide (TPR) repeat protein
MNYSVTNNIGWLGLTLIYLGEYERGKGLLEKAMELNPFYPWCYSFTMSVYYYIKEEYELARHWAEKMNLASPKFDLVLRTAILGKLGLEHEGRLLVRELTQIWPAVDREIQGFLQKFILEEAIVGQLLKGVQFFGIAAHL